MTIQTRKEAFVELETGEILPYVEGKEYEHLCVRVFEQERPVISKENLENIVKQINELHYLLEHFLEDGLYLGLIDGRSIFWSLVEFEDTDELYDLTLGIADGSGHVDYNIEVVEEEDED